MPEELIGNMWATKCVSKHNMCQANTHIKLCIGSPTGAFAVSSVDSKDQMILNAGGKTHVRLPEYAG